ncbi:MAG: hypothetical protein K5840_08575, partial [Eubacterium sp.]|nr:hypothetical protein [Eubacterium sp.]
IIISLAAVLIGAGALMLTGEGALSRITEISLTESTLVGRALYALDALPLLVKYPLGLGYMGYYYIQNSIQTGWYSVMFVHNDLLQLGLDAGIVPMVCYAAAVVWGLFSRQVSSPMKTMLAVLFVHGLLDFDMAFSGMAFLMLLILDDVKIGRSVRMDAGDEDGDPADVDDEDGNPADVVDIKPSPGGIPVALRTKCVLGLFALAGVYLCVPLAAFKAGNTELTLRLYPSHTEALIAELSETEDADEAKALAEGILSHNKYCALAWYAKAMVADIDGDYDAMIKYGRRAIDLDYFNVEEYRNYVNLLYDGLISGDEDAYEKCRQEVLALPDLMDENMQKLSPLGKMIDDQPELTVDDTLRELIDAVK